MLVPPCSAEVRLIITGIYRPDSQLQDLRGGRVRRIFTCGSMVLPILFRFFLFALYERKKEETIKDEKYRSAEGYKSFRYATA
jgi:hypothetical protein